MHRAQTSIGVTSDEIQTSATAAKFAQIDRVDSLQNKVRDQTKRHTILVRDGCMLVATTEKADAYLLCLFFGENDQFTLQLRGTSH